jgi:ABC-type multidrug transport system permease subunit
LVLPMLAASALDMPVSLDEVIGSWLFFSIFAYFFAGPSAAVAGALYGWMKYRSDHRSRWGVGALAGTLGWLLQISVAALWAADVEHLQAIVLTPLALAAGALCGRLFDVDRSTAGAPPP